MSLHPKVLSWEVAPSITRALPGTYALCFLLLTASMMFQYFVKVVPTVYMKVDGEVSHGAELPGFVVPPAWGVR